MRAPLLLLAVAGLGLAACQTPREACISQGQAQLRTIEALIRETQGNLTRGYAIEEEQEVRVERDFCTVRDDDGNVTGHVFCDRTEVRDVERPVAIDLAAERAQLDGLLAQRETLAAQQAGRIEACTAAYPE